MNLSMNPSGLPHHTFRSNNATFRWSPCHQSLTPRLLVKYTSSTTNMGFLPVLLILRCLPIPRSPVPLTGLAFMVCYTPPCQQPPPHDSCKRSRTRTTSWKNGYLHQVVMDPPDQPLTNVKGTTGQDNPMACSAEEDHFNYTHRLFARGRGKFSMPRS